MRTLTLGLSGLACMVALMAATATPASSQPRGHTSANRGEEAGYRYRQHGYGYRPHYRPYAYYDPYYYDPYYYPYYYQPYYGPSVSFSFGF
jgi:hypothetical protein